jgi:hypothetical protein
MRSNEKIIVGVVLAVIAVWFLFFRKPRRTSGILSESPYKDENGNSISMFEWFNYHYPANPLS